MRTPLPDGGCHQCCTSPSTNWRAAERSRCSRTQRRLGVHERHHVLQLIAEAEGAARLVEGRCAPTGGRRSPGRAASRWPARRATGRAFAPAPRRARVSQCAFARFERGARGVAAAPAAHQRAGLVDALARRRGGRRSRVLRRRQARRRRAARRRDRARRRRGPTDAARPAPPVPRSEPLRPKKSPRSPQALRRCAVDIEERDAAVEVGVVGVAREEGACLGVELGDDLHQRLRRSSPSTHSTIAGDAEPARPAASVAQSEHRELDRRVDRDVDAELGLRCRLRVCSKTL